MRQIADATGEELTSTEILEAFETEYFARGERFELINQRTVSEARQVEGTDIVTIEGMVTERGRPTRNSPTIYHSTAIVYAIRCFRFASRRSLAASGRQTKTPVTR